METFYTLLRVNRLRVTPPRKAVFTMLMEAVEPLSIRSLIQNIPTHDRVSIYRTLETFEKFDIVRVVHVGWKKRYELSDPFMLHHHHLHCEQCGRFIELADDKIEELVHHLADEQHFTVRNHSFEINGICSDCAKPRHTAS